MTYVFEYVVGSDNVKVEYCFSSISDSIKVADMWVYGKFHRTNWMSPEGNKMLMARLEADYKSRVDVDSFIDDITKASYESEMDLDRDTPEWLGHS